MALFATALDGSGRRVAVAPGQQPPPGYALPIGVPVGNAGNRVGFVPTRRQGLFRGLFPVRRNR